VILHDLGSKDEAKQLIKEYLRCQMVDEVVGHSCPDFDAKSAHEYLGNRNIKPDITHGERGVFKKTRRKGTRIYSENGSDDMGHSVPHANSRRPQFFHIEFIIMWWLRVACIHLAERLLWN